MPDGPYGQPVQLKTFADVKAKFDEYLKEELESKSKALYLKKGFLREFGYVNCIPLNAPDGIVTYRIYADGIIEKHIPKTITKGFENKYKYIYHGSKNVQNEICTVDWHEIIEKNQEVIAEGPNQLIVMWFQKQKCPKVKHRNVLFTKMTI